MDIRGMLNRFLNQARAASKATLAWFLEIALLYVDMETKPSKIYFGNATKHL